MARKKSPSRTSKPKKYCFVVEGCTEENYINLLKGLYQKHKVGRLENNKGGSAKAVLQKAERLIEKYKNDYLGYVLWFDEDTYFISQDCNKLNSMKAKKNVEIYMSVPCIEHWLLAHFQNINLSQENNCPFYVNKLKNYIPNYDKNDCHLLNRYIDTENIERAITRYPKIGEIPNKYFLNH
ncbi:MAG: hypothetical protein DRQ49_11940 [Gammaproteobacteria bacterium]|nr:MAG: hypothetical protein DRQ49_11940 [Gammaproteobacteria bacterium]RKZ74572.1 MAG: hypothetical protein DRQ57_10510 [Gammaproteobacteria bacterium]